MSGLNQWIANPPYSYRGTEGSNPSLSASRSRPLRGNPDLIYLELWRFEYCVPSYFAVAFLIFYP